MGIVAEITQNADVADSVSNGQCDVVVATCLQARVFGLPIRPCFSPILRSRS